jgi:hypothetical protein
MHGFGLKTRLHVLLDARFAGMTGERLLKLALMEAVAAALD